MKRTKLIFISLLIFILLSLTAISAAESADSDDALMADDSNMGELSINNTDDNSVETSNQDTTDEKLSANTGSFTELQNKINQYDGVGLNYDYKYVDGEDRNGIIIDKWSHIYGNGYSIDGAKQSRIFTIKGEHSVYIYDLTFKNAKCSGGSGGAIYLEKNAHLTLENCVFENNKAYDDGGAIYMESGSTLTIKNTRFTSNSVEVGVTRSDDGGAIYSKGTLIIESCTFEKNSAYGDGGAIYSAGTFSISGSCKFNHNYASNNGGAIYVKSDNGIEFTNCEFKDNTARKYNGGAICSDGSGKTTLKNCNFTNNKVETTVGSNSGAFVDFKGGAVYADNELEIDNCIFKDNYAFDCGGAVYANKGLRWGDNPSIFIGNKLTPYTADVIHRKGGAVYATKFNSDPHDLVFINNTGEYGGAIYINNENHLTFESCYFENNIGSASKTESLNGQGGAIYLDSSSSELTLINNIFINNRAKEGQAIYNCGEYGTIANNYWGTNNPNFDTDLIIEWHRIGSNDKHKDSSPLKLELYLDESAIGMENNYLLTARFTDSNGNPFTGHLTNLGAINFVANKRATFSSKTVQNNNVTTMFKPLENGEYSLSAKFGNVVLTTINFKVMGSFEYLQYQINTASRNDVIDLNMDVNYNPAEYSAPKGLVINKDLTINGNGHIINGAGLIRILNILSDNVKINNVTFVDGKADYGAAIYVSSANSVVISNCEFRNNRATFDGGAIYLKASNSNITNCKFFNNQISQDHGGAVSCDGQNDRIISCEFRNNRAYDDGGAVSARGKDNLVSNSIFINNTAYNAGALYWSAFNGKVEGCDFINNSAENNGGAIYWIGNTGVIDKSTFKGNSAKNKGGAVYSDDDLGLTMQNSCFLDNKEKSYKITFSTTETNINVEYSSYSHINAIYAAYVNKVHFTNVTYWNGTIANTDVGGYTNFRAIGQKVNIEIYNENNNLVKNVTLITDAEGKASYLFTELNDGKYTFSVCHYDDSYYGYYRTSTEEFTIQREEMEGNISFNNLQDEYAYGDITINFTVENRNEVKVTITNEEQTQIFLDKIVEGDNVTFSLPADETYRIVLSNLGNQTHKTKEVAGIFTIVKATPEIEISEIGTVQYGNNITISYTSNYPSIFLIGVTNIGTGERIYANLTRQNPIILSNLDIGNYQVEIYAKEEENFTSGKATINFEISGQPLTNMANVSVSEATYGEESIITVNAEIDGVYTVDINGTKVNVTVVDAKGNASISLAPGNYYANLTFNNPNYNTIAKNTTFDVLKIESMTYVYGPDEITFGNNATILIDGFNLTSFEVTLKNEAGEIVFYNVTSEEIITFANLAVGQYNVTVINLGNENIAESECTISFNVTMNNHVYVYVNNATYGEEVYLIVLADVDGKYSVDVNNTIITIDVTGGYGYDLLNLAAGQYYANITAIDKTGYDNNITNTTFNIEKAKSNVKITEIKNNVAEGSVTINFNDDYPTTFWLDINDTSYYMDNATSITIPLTPGEYNVTVTSIGNENVTGSQDSALFNVTNNNYVYVYVNDVVCGEEVQIYIIANVDGNYTVHVNSTEVKIKVENGIGEGNITLDVGSYYANATFEDDGDYNHIITNATFNVTPYGSEVIIEDIEDVYKGDDVIVRFRCENLTSFTVYLFNENGTYINETNTTENSIILSGLDEGIYVVFIEAIGNENITGSSDYAIFEVIGYNIIFVDVDDVTYGEDAIVIIDAAINGIYSVDINGTIVNVTVANGTGNTSVSLAAGNYHANATLVGSQLENICIDDIFTVLKASSNVTIEPIKEVAAGNNVKIEFNDAYITIFNVTVRNNAGKIVFNATINGNSVEVPNLAAGEYVVVVVAPENENVSGSVAAMSFKVTEPVTYKLTGKDVAMYYFDGTKYQVKITRSDGKPVGANQIVVIKLNKKTYKVKTDKNGVAILKIPNTVKPGTYKVTATYNGQTIKNTIKVKQNLKSKKTVKVKKSAKKLVLKATLKNGKKAVKGKKITFKFKGKTYKAKTNKKGIAKVTIKKKVIKKLKAGKKYPVKITYLKNTIKTKVKVRR